MPAFDQLRDFYSACSLKNIDFINILYHSNDSFRNTFLLVLPPTTKQPTNVEINKSYDKFFKCKKINNPNIDDISHVDAEINEKYLEVYTNSYTMSALNKDTF
jgi:hypothetical protein